MAVRNRYDFVLLFDVTDGNPNGDPDAGNLPRLDPETGHGFVTDVCLKRKVRNYVYITRGSQPGYDIFIKEKGVLNRLIENAYRDEGIDLTAPPANERDGRTRRKKGSAQGSEIDLAQRRMCKDYFDIRAFGAVLSTGPNAGQVRGPLQLTFARSIDPVLTLEHSITRMAVATEEEAEAQSGDARTMGRKSTVPYGLYRAHGFLSPHFAEKTGFTEEDLEVFWDALANMFDHDRSATRGLMAMRRIIVFRHQSPLGNAPAHRLFDLVQVRRRDATTPPRALAAYEVAVGAPPQGVEIEDRLLG